MSHSTVLVTKTNKISVDKQLEPFNEQGKPNDYFMEWVDKTEEYRQQYETETVREFYCGSSSSWGQQITKEFFETLQGAAAGSVFRYEVKNLGGVLNYFRNHEKYRGYYELQNGKRCEGSVWFAVISVNKTDHPDRDVCFEGEITVQVIDPPRDMPLKDRYPDYNTYLSDWHGVDDPSQQGYWSNPNARWDWYKVGGRWAGYFQPKAGSAGQRGENGLMGSNRSEDGVDIIKVKDIDWESMEQRIRDDRRQEWQEEMAKPEDQRFRWDEEARACKSEDEYAGLPVHLATFAVLHDGKWYERGEMGWWGVVSDEKDREEWNSQFRKLLDELNPDDEVTLVDVHI